MFEKITPDQREAWLRKVHSVDATLKSVIEPAEASKPARSVRRLHLVPALHALHPPHERKSAAA